MTRQFTPERINHPEWLLMVVHDGASDHHVSMSVPDESFVRRLLRFPE